MTLCELCGVSRSGYYKWKKRDGAPPEDRKHLFKLVKECHEAHLTHGYRWIHAYLVKHNGIKVSADYIRRICRVLGISAQTKRKPGTKGKHVRQESYPNLIFSTWDTVDRPRQVIVSDMTAFWTTWHYYELALYFDAHTKEIVGRGLTRRRGYNGIYYEGLEQSIESIQLAREEAVGSLEEGSGEITVIHTDCGSVYTSKAYNEIVKEAGLVRSCSRPGKPTDNPVNESMNGWIKEELMVDFHLRDVPDCEIMQVIDEYIEWYNNERPCWSLGYKTPRECYREFMDGHVEPKDTFANRKLDPTPKFVLARLAKAQSDAEGKRVGTSNAVFSA